MTKFIVKKFEVYAVNVLVDAPTDDEEEVKKKVEGGDYEYYEDPRYEGDLPSATLQFVEKIADGIPE